ncbi:alpha amylase, catalytic domain protein, partial [Vibrio parahaemolyticus V-223/04]
SLTILLCITLGLIFSRKVKAHTGILNPIFATITFLIGRVITTLAGKESTICRY